MGMDTESGEGMKFILLKVLKLFLSSSSKLRLGRVAALSGHLTKCHALPLLFGGVAGAVFFEFVDVAKVEAIATLVVNQSILDGICAAYDICGLTVASGSAVVLSTLFGAIATLAAEHLYNVESPKMKALAKAEEVAEDILDAAKELGTQPKVEK